MRRIPGLGRFLGWGGSALLLTSIVVVLAVDAGATPPFGFSVNQILASGYIPGNVSQHMQLNRNTDGSVTPWQLQLQAQGGTDVYSQHLVLVPGGHSGWHTHPGLLIAVVKSGQIDFFDSDCNGRTIGPGQVYTENDEVHGIINNGTVDADLYISYLVKHGAARRREASAPPCAVETGIP